MLLKTNFVPIAPEGYFDGLWASVEQRLDGDPEADAARASGGNGGSADQDNKAQASEGDELVFHSSAALKVLNIPDRRPKHEPSRDVAAPGRDAPAAAAPMAPSSDPTKQAGYAWPVAFVLAAGIVTGGFLYYKKQNERATAATGAQIGRTGTIAAAGGGSAANTAEGAASANAGGSAAASADAMAVASAAGAGSAAAGSTAAGSTAAGSTAAGSAPASGSGADDNATKSPSSATPSPALAAATRGARARRSRRRGKRAAAKSKADAKSRTVAAAAPPARKVARKGGGTALDSLIDGALGKPAAAAKTAPQKTQADPTLPKQLNMNQIRTVMRKIRGRVQGCYDKFQIEGSATARVQIAPNGRVMSVVIKGKFFGTDTGACVAKAVRKARFPKFGGKMMTIKYPFLLQ